MTVKLRQSGRLTLNGIIVAVLLSASSAFAGVSEDCAAAAAFGQQDYAAALRLCRPLAEQGDASAQTALGTTYYGGRGVPQNYTEAAKWYRKAAEQGDVYGETALGFMYDEGWGVEQNYTDAANWFPKAAERGDATGQFGLGSAYEQGHGLPQDFVHTHMWYNLAAAQGDDVAAKDRDELTKKMEPAQIAEAQRLAREWKPTK